MIFMALQSYPNVCDYNLLLAFSGKSIVCDMIVSADSAVNCSAHSQMSVPAATFDVLYQSQSLITLQSYATLVPRPPQT